MSTIVVNSLAGQRSNRLVTVAHAMATAIERGASLRLTTFCEFKDDYKRTITWGGRVVIRKSRWWEFVRLIIAAMKRLGFKKVLHLKVFSDWSGRNYEALEKHESEVRSFFMPAIELPAMNRRTGVILIGVHKRRGDYKDFLGGMYYFEDEVYEKNMLSLKEEIERGGLKAEFIIFPREDAVRDQWSMSQCDYLMGPPSTFSMWASFMGRVPLGLIKNKETCLKIKDFVYGGLIA